MSGSRRKRRDDVDLKDLIAESRKANQWLKQEEKEAYKNPAEYARWLVAFVLKQREKRRKLLLDEYGLRMDYDEDSEPFGRPYIADHDRFPAEFRQSPEDYAKFVSLRREMDGLAWFDGARAIAGTAILDARDEGKDEKIAVLESVFWYARQGPWLASPTSKVETDPILREIYATSLAAFVGSNISLRQHKRLDNILREDLKKEGSSSEKLVEELLSTTILAFDDLEDGEPFAPGEGKRSLVSRVESLLVGMGDQAARLARRGKLSSEPPDERLESSAPTAEDELKQVERQEIQEQRIRCLESLIERAGLSYTETRVLELDRKGLDNKAIAEELSIKPATVRVLRHRYLKKLRKAAGL